MSALLSLFLHFEWNNLLHKSVTCIFMTVSNIEGILENLDCESIIGKVGNGYCFYRSKTKITKGYLGYTAKIVECALRAGVKSRKLTTFYNKVLRPELIKACQPIGNFYNYIEE